MRGTLTALRFAWAVAVSDPVGLVAGAVILATVTSCASAQHPGARDFDQNARASLAGTAHALVLADAVAATAFEYQAGHMTDDQLPELAARYRPVLVALDTARESLLSAQSAMDVYRDVRATDSGCRAWVAANGVARTVRHLIASLEAAGVPGVPGELTEAVNALEGLTAPVAAGCTETAGR